MWALLTSPLPQQGALQEDGRILNKRAWKSSPMAVGLQGLREYLNELTFMCLFMLGVYHKNRRSLLYEANAMVLSHTKILNQKIKIHNKT